MKSFENIYILHRLLSKARAPVSFDQICEALDCSASTAHRTINELRDGLGAPIERTRDPNGYIYTDTAYQLPGIWFTPAQLQALLLIQQLLRSFQPGLLDDMLEPLRDKLKEILEYLGVPAESESRIRLLRMAARPVGPCFNTVASAVIQRHRLAIRYEARSTGEVSSREVCPQRLIYYKDNWYLDAWCHKQQSLRIFSLDCIPEATLLDTPATTVPDEVIDAQFAAGYGIFAGPVTAIACLRFSAHSARWVASEQWHPAQVGKMLESGEYQLEIPYSRPDELIMDIMRRGAEVEVLAPAELRQAVAERHRAAAALYN